MIQNTFLMYRSCLTLSINFKFFITTYFLLLKSFCNAIKGKIKTTNYQTLIKKVVKTK